jgi:acetyl esterase/lipase
MIRRRRGITYRVMGDERVCWGLAVGGIRRRHPDRSPNTRVNQGTNSPKRRANVCRKSSLRLGSSHSSLLPMLALAFGREVFRRPFARFFAVAGLVTATTVAHAADIKVLADLAYNDAIDGVADAAEHCRIDLYLPAGKTGFVSMIWLHGGGLTGGSRKSDVNLRVARRLAESGIAVAMADYRLNPAVTFPAYVHDAAKAFAWLRANIASHGGDPGKVYIGGHSAGAYLALMVALDDQYLAACGLDEKSLAGVVAISGQTVTHFTVRAERQLPEGRVVIDDAAPLFFVDKSKVPFLLLYADNDMVMRADENRLLGSALRSAGCETVIERLCADRDHGTIYSRMAEPDDPVAADVMQFLREPVPVRSVP